MLYGVLVRDDKCFIANDDKGVAIVDITEPKAPRTLGRVKTSWAYGCEFDPKGRLIVTQGTGDTLLLTDISDLRTLDTKPLSGLSGYAVKFLPGRGEIAAIATAKGVLAADISTPERPNLLARAEFVGNAFDIAVAGDIAFVANGAHGVRVIDLSTPSNPKHVALLNIGGLTFEKLQKEPIRQQGTASWLKVVGKRVVDERGEPYRLVAVGYPMVNFTWCEPLMRYRFGDIEGICAYLRSLGVNAIRLAFNPPFTDYPVSSVPSPAHRYPTPEEFVEREIIPVVKRIEASGMYVILDMHEAHDYTTLFSWAMQVWRVIAKRFSNDPYIAWYELWQEPFFYPKEAREAKMESGQARRQHMPGQRLYYMEAIRQIRRFDKRHIVMVEDYGPWWWVAEEQWAPVNFRVDPGFDNAIFAKRAAYGNGFSEAFRKYVGGLMDKWDVPICLAEIEIGHRYNKPEDWFYFVYGWLANEERIVPLQFWAVSDVEVMMADLWAPFVKRRASPPPPPKQVAEPKTLRRIVIDATKFKGGKTVSLQDGNKKITAICIPSDSPVGSGCTFKLPNPLPIAKYRVTVRLFSDGMPAFPQAIVYIDKDGRQYPPDSVLGGWGEDHFYYANHHVIPVFLYTQGWVQWRTTWEPLSEIAQVQLRKVKGVPYLGDCERQDADTRPISQIVIEAIEEE